MNRAFIFPGQGSQIIGMGLDFYKNFSIAKETFQEVDDTIKYKLSDIIFSGSSEELTLTKNTQPALMAVSIAIIRVLKTQTNTEINQICDVVAGHSLGEYSALCATNSLSLAHTAALLQIRGSSMQQACPESIGAMAACIGIDIVELEKLITENISSGICQIANDNIEGQVVISGHAENIDKMIDIIKSKDFKAIKLKVSAPFHCALMQPVENQMRQALSGVKINNPLVPIITNIDARMTSNAANIKENLALQVCGRVRWRQTLHQFKQLAITEIVEVGSGRILTGMIKKTAHNYKLTNISNLPELEEFINSL